jgi:hypothetical protein
MKAMKLIFCLIVFITSTLSFAGPGGDGTLPVIRSVEVSFIDGNIPRLPSTMNIDVNVLLQKNEHIIKKLKVKKLDLDQQIKLSNVEGELKVDVKSMSSTNAVAFKSVLQAVNSHELFNELLMGGNTLTQSIKVNFK